MRHLEHPYVRFLDLEQAVSCKRFKHTAAPILAKKKRCSDSSKKKRKAWVGAEP